MPRRNLIRNSPNQEIYERLLESGWSSTSLERYAQQRFGEAIDECTFRRHRARLERGPEQVEDERLARLHRDELVDVLQLRGDLIRLQKARVLTDVALEIGDRGMNKLMTSTRHEIELLSTLLDAHIRDLQAVGVLPTQRVEVAHRATVPELETRSLQEILGVDADEDALARVVHMALVKTGGDDGAA